MENKSDIFSYWQGIERLTLNNGQLRPPRRSSQTTYRSRTPSPPRRYAESDKHTSVAHMKPRREAGPKIDKKHIKISKSNSNPVVKPSYDTVYARTSRAPCVKDDSGSSQMCRSNHAVHTPMKSPCKKAIPQSKSVHDMVRALESSSPQKATATEKSHTTKVGDIEGGHNSIIRQKKRNTNSFGRRRHSTESSASKRSSGFICYLDEEASDDPHHRTHSHSPPELSHMERFITGIERTSKTEYFVECTRSNAEMSEFWDMVDRIHALHNQEASAHFLIAPAVSHKTKKPELSRHSSVVGLIDKGGEFKLSVNLRTMTDEEEVMLKVHAESTVSDVITAGLRKLTGAETYRSSDTSVKICGRDEFLESCSQLCTYEYVQQCRKMAKNIRLILVQRAEVNIPTSGPIKRPLHQKPTTASLQEVNDVLNKFYSSHKEFLSALSTLDGLNSLHLSTLAQSVENSAKVLCGVLHLETPAVTEALFNFRRACKTATQHEFETSTLFSPEESQTFDIPPADPWISIPDSEYILSEGHVKDISSALDGIQSSFQKLISLYCKAFCPGYRPVWWSNRETETDISHCTQKLKIKVCALHRINESELRKFESLLLEVCVYYGGQPLSRKVYSPRAKMTRSVLNTVVWDKHLNMGVDLSSLPRESRVLFTLYGLELPGSGYKWTRTPIAWTILRLFNSKGYLDDGVHLLGLWLGDEASPLDSPYYELNNLETMLLQVSLEESADLLRYPVDLKHREPKHPGPPPNVQRALAALAKKDRFQTLSSDDQVIVWSNRFSCAKLLSMFPRGLPTVLLSTPSWCQPHLADIWAILKEWPCVDPAFGLELLDAQFSDTHVRDTGVTFLSKFSNDDICDFLPQLVQAVCLDSFQTSALTDLLLLRAKQCQRIAHYLYWHLKLVVASDVRFRQRFEPLLEAVQLIVLHQDFKNQVELIERLCNVAKVIKSVRDSHRQTILVEELKKISPRLPAQFRLPLDPALLASGIDIESCSFFNSNTVPLKLSFLNADKTGDNIPVIFKVGDDLRQDILVLQMIRLMDKIWTRAGLDLKMVTYRCVATGLEEGMLEMVTEAATLRTIQTEHGLTGSFKDKPLSEWLKRHNPTENDYKQAVENFTVSCAGYCVATYVLGICDRHNDNIMVKKTGHMFHIDFGKILGNAQMFGNIKRDRVPFVLTRDMAYVINDGDKPTSNFQKFIDLCCTAYNELRKHSSLFITLLSLMMSSGLTEVSSLDDVKYVRDALLPDKSDADATYQFTKYIEDSLGSLATQINFFIHNLAQFKFSTPTSVASVLSFCPQTYSITTEGKIYSAFVTAYHKRFYPDTHYIYEIEVCHNESGQSSKTVFRRYREFAELHNKLLQSFPNDNLPHLPGKVYTPRKSNTQQTAERRLTQLNSYIKELISMDCKVSESDIVYTFLHCLIRDEKELAKLTEASTMSEVSAGKIKVELTYSTKQQSLSVMIRHVRNLQPRDTCDTADPYVKLYLLPDPDKSTKMKTKIAKRTLHPTYNETLTYTIPRSALNHKSLQLSIWDARHALSKQCLCSTLVELSSIQAQLKRGDTVSNWYELHNTTNR